MKGKEKGKGKLEVKRLQKRKKSQTPQLGIKPETQASVADALLLSHRDKRHHQPVCLKFYLLCLHFAGIIQYPQLTNPLRSGDPSRSPLCITHGRNEKLNGINATNAFLSANERSKGKGRGKEEKMRKEKGKRKFEVNLWQKRRFVRGRFVQHTELKHVIEVVDLLMK